eukprot:TRINITY_DN6107_c0_g1_i1.p2 TRINITY_DN6107_c0_g1~~TRINITY_DN6107_c0_g1_i1.p2  ORF type:complete len:284 (-),score=20.62 TRINITY_DN6107_c0_g1_i1:1180-2031(-)
MCIRDRYLREKKEVEKEKKAEKESEGCTFKPQLISKPIQRSDEYDPGRSHDQSSKFNKLYEHAMSAKRKKEEMAEKARRMREQQELEGCTFKPVVETGSLKEKSFVHEEASNIGSVPKGYEESVNRLIQGRVKKELKEKALQKFSRGENYEKLRKMKVNPPSFLGRGNQSLSNKSEAKLLLYIDVNLAPGKTRRIAIHEGDEPGVLADNFARVYSLNQTMRDTLENLLQSYLDKYYDEQPQPVDSDGQNQSLYTYPYSMFMQLKKLLRHFICLHSQNLFYRRE